jgi:hypothetical protein
MIEALERLDYNRLRRLLVRMRRNAAELKRQQEVTERELPEEFPTNAALDARADQAELLDEVSRSGIGNVLREKHALIRALVSRHLTPVRAVANPTYPTERSRIPVHSETCPSCNAIPRWWCASGLFLSLVFPALSRASGSACRTPTLDAAALRAGASRVAARHSDSRAGSPLWRCPAYGMSLDV